MTQSTIDVAARVRFAKSCLAGAREASRTGWPSVAAELRASARQALDGLGAELAPPSPYRSQTQAYARVLLQGLH